MLKTLFALSTILALLTTALSQDGGAALKGRLNKDKPAVYIELECQDDSTLRLRLHNNTPWALAIPTLHFPLNPKNVVSIRLKNGTTVFPLPNDRDVSVFYHVEKDGTSQKIDVPSISYADSFDESWIASNGLIRLLVPKTNLREGLQIHISFNYEWELGDQGIIHNDIDHRVVLRGVDLVNQGVRPACH
jgi:hypothetical protein